MPPDNVYTLAGPFLLAAVAIGLAGVGACFRIADIWHARRWARYAAAFARVP